VDPKMTEVIDRLIAAADRVGMEGARLWPDVVRITFVISVFWLIATPLFGLALTAAANAIRVRLWRWADAEIAKEDARREQQRKTGQHVSSIRDDEGAWIVKIGSGVLLAAVVVVSCWTTLTFTPNNLAGTLYPEAKTVLDLAAKLR
jgi:hypothetical protein